MWLRSLSGLGAVCGQELLLLKAARRSSCGPDSGRSRGLAIGLLTRSSPRKSLLLRLQSGRPCLYQGIFDGPHNVRWENWSVFHRSWHRLLPRFQHLVHLPPDRVVHRGVCLHEGLVQLSPKEEGIRRADVLDYRVKDVQRGELLVCRCLGDRSAHVDGRLFFFKHRNDQKHKGIQASSVFPGKVRALATHTLMI